MRVVGGLVGEVLDEEQVVRAGGVAVHAEGQRAFLRAGAFRRELLDDRLRFGLPAGLEWDREHLGEHGFLLVVGLADADHDRRAAPPVSGRIRTRSMSGYGRYHARRCRIPDA